MRFARSACTLGPLLSLRVCNDISLSTRICHLWIQLNAFMFIDLLQLAQINSPHDSLGVSPFFFFKHSVTIIGLYRCYFRLRDCFKKIKTPLNLSLVQGVQEVLVKLGSQGSALFVEGEEPIRQPIVPATEVIDTTGAGDTFTSAFAVALVEGKPKRECMRFAGTKPRPLQYLTDWFPCILI